jgi:hypothetical protein
MDFINGQIGMASMAAATASPLRKWLTDVARADLAWFGLGTGDTLEFIKALKAQYLSC